MILPIRKLRLLLCLALLCAPFPAQVSKPVALADIMAKIQGWRKATDFKATGRLVRVAESGERTSYRIAFRARFFADGLKVFCEVIDPPPVKVRMLLEMRVSGGARIRVGHAGDPAPKELAAASFGDSLLGTDFSFEDLMDDHFQWKNQALLEKAQFGARQCYVIKSEPSAADRSQYSSVTSWVDQKIYYPVRLEKVVTGLGTTKEFTNYGLRESKGRWSASQIKVETKGKPGSSLLIITGGVENAGLKAAQFDPALLTKPD
jgi:hypothetical protein